MGQEVSTGELLSAFSKPDELRAMLATFGFDEAALNTAIQEIGPTRSWKGCSSSWRAGSRQTGRARSRAASSGRSTLPTAARTISPDR